MGAERRRLRRLEQEAAKLDPTAPAGRTRPTDHELGMANTLDEYYEIWERHGRSREEVEEESEWRQLVEERCAEAGYESWMVIGDMVKWFESTGRPHHEMEDVLRDYPGPGYW